MQSSTTLHDWAPILIGVLALFGFAVFVVLFWVLPITLGVKILKRKGYSPYWMWFGVHPLAGWIMVIISASLRPRLRCEKCGGFVAHNFRLCPYCGSQSFQIQKA